ncbi:hypothetical protein [Lapillicoccus sp.]|uniref:hypothetical protein n=1 Tax=Lapillicoccus sp. TaxID=1909287 RepID=UPI00398385DB
MILRLVLLTSLALVSACGSGASGSGAAASGGATSGSAARSVFPVTVTRVGGIAGFDDRVVVQVSGATGVSTRSGPRPGCTLTPAALAGLDRAVRELDANPPTAATSAGRVSDQMAVTVAYTRPDGGGSLGEAAGDEVAAVTGLLDDVTGASPAYALCTKD